jgi:transcriptional regulator
MEPRSTQLLRGTLDVLILKTLVGQTLHGYAIAAHIAERTEGALGIEDGALYQSLHRMEERGWVESAWGHADNGKRAKFYRLTAAGRRRLQVETASWVRYAEAVFKVLQPA